ncbi:glycoside hydrolase family 64 protein [Hypoxylon fragiforme]|uniref:glycoside hydrolase family 64 protein n=1 Tax=Hypoxylon fragiforme TaxID=63214 RepID=UPI0020C5C9BE|nr:glycoside hydrolase family 64 protein [Hypoxylon fragiforme]KAI2610027.1 glycoside hydrolase family 64 protein [Hypoxylon fragiforme]
MPNSLNIALRNTSNSDQVYAYITGIALQHGGQRCILQADGHGLYFPQNPPRICSPLAEDCAIPLGPPGSTVTVTIPQMAGGRIWVSRGGKLTFLLNPGPALVEPSVLNPTDPNRDLDFGFCEFTLNDAQLYANLTYVDFVPRLPLAMTLTRVSGSAQHVAGMPPEGLDRLAADLREQARSDGLPWDRLVVERNGTVLRVLNPTHGNGVGARFSGYFEPFVDAVWARYRERQQQALMIDTQAAPGVLRADFTSDSEVVVGKERFGRPSTADILGCNSGPFTTGPSPVRNAIIPRLAAAFARSALLEDHRHPSPPDTFYRREPTNHYARLVHAHTVDGKGYAFAYDDVQPSGGDDQSGKVNAGDPVLLTVTVGGGLAQ